MGRHKEWRKEAKKARRKRIRTALALERLELENKEKERLENSPRYQAWLKEQQTLDEFTKEEEERVAREALLKWEADEILAQEKWAKQQEIAKAEAEIIERQQALIREEWDREQNKIKEEKERKEKEDKKKKEELERLFAEMDLFINGDLKDLPSELNITVETQPGKPLCPFFQKVGACRFKESCSRNHIRPGVSKSLLLPGFYTHFSLSSVHQAEYDTDIALEYDHFETYKHFKEFYEDVKEEFEKFGELTQLKVCSNEEPHLRGNVYIEYNEERAAVAAFRALNGRYYAGKRISVEFTVIPSWKQAVCGLQFKKSCPKGALCNFLHIFRNPHGEFNNFEEKKTSKDQEWKWSDTSDSDNEKHSRSSRRRRRQSRSRESHRWRTRGRRSRSKDKRSKGNNLTSSRRHSRERRRRNRD